MQRFIYFIGFLIALLVLASWVLIPNSLIQLGTLVCGLVLWGLLSYKFLDWRP